MLQGSSDSLKAIFHGIIKHATATRLRTAENLNYNILQLLSCIRERTFVSRRTEIFENSSSTFSFLSTSPFAKDILLFNKIPLMHLLPFRSFRKFFSFNTSSHLPGLSTGPHFWGNYFVQFIYISKLHSGSTLQTTFYAQILWNFQSLVETNSHTKQIDTA